MALEKYKQSLRTDNEIISVNTIACIFDRVDFVNLPLSDQDSILTMLERFLDNPLEEIDYMEDTPVIEYYTAIKNGYKSYSDLGCMLLDLKGEKDCFFNQEGYGCWQFLLMIVDFLATSPRKERLPNGDKLRHGINAASIRAALVETLHFKAEQIKNLNVTENWLAMSFEDSVLKNEERFFVQAMTSTYPFIQAILSINNNFNSVNSTYSKQSDEINIKLFSVNTFIPGEVVRAIASAINTAQGKILQNGPAFSTQSPSASASSFPDFNSYANRYTFAC